MYDDGMGVRIKVKVLGSILIFFLTTILLLG
jgi:hypothetical protein